MASQNSEIEGDIRTFKEVTLDKVRTKIIIPKFQRDYAQGREGKEELRNNFLEDLFSVVENTSSTAQQRIYDFIYGQQEGPNERHEDENYFYPVDGQQRLTTIFLLSLYVGKRAVAMKAIEKEELEFLRKFSYETRDSSLQFCKLLCDIEAEHFVNISEYLEDHHRMTGAWLNDPTICGMKRMLSDIYNHFANLRTPDFKLYWKNTTEKIAFWRLYINDLQNIDDLYIKMNSRGKHLSDFENFKAEVDQLAQKYGKADGEFQKELDTTWTNLFWAYRDTANDYVFPDYENPEQKDFTDNGLDEKMLTFFRNYLIIAGVKSGSLPESAVGMAMSSIQLAKTVIPTVKTLFDDLEKILRFFNVKKNPAGKLNTFFEEFLTKRNEQEFYASNPSDLSTQVNPLFNTEIDLFEEMMTKPNLSIPQKLTIEAFFKYVLLVSTNPNSITVDDFRDRLRNLRNFIAYNYLHDDDTVHKGKMKENLNSVDELIAGGVTAIKGRPDQFTEPLKAHEEDKAIWMKTASANDVASLKQIENYEVVRGILTQIKGLSGYSSHKLTNFREIFHFGVDYDFIEKVLIATGPYYSQWINREGTAFNYVGPSWDRFRDVIFRLDNTTSAQVFEKLLTAQNVSHNDLETFCNDKLTLASAQKKFDWDYYIIKYKAMRWAPKGHYLRMKNCSYLTYMFRAQTCYHYDSLDHWNVYNDALAMELGIDDNKYVDKHGGSLMLPGINAQLDIVEDRINLHLSDGTDYYIRIPQAGGVDIVDRVEFAKYIAEKLIALSKRIYTNEEGDESITFIPVTSDVVDNQNCKRLIKIAAMVKSDESHQPEDEQVGEV